MKAHDCICAYFMRNYFFHGFESKMAGIENIGSHCFFNSLIHCVINRQEVRHALFNHFTFHTKKQSKKDVLCAQCELGNLATMLFAVEGMPVPGSSLLNLFKVLRVNHKEQGDPRELFVLLVGEFYPQWQIHFIIGQAQKVECDLCKAVSVTNLATFFLDVSTNNLTLQDAVDEAFLPELVGDYECKDCGTVSAQKTLSISKLPHILTLHCKGAGYVVPTKELNVGDDNFYLDSFIVFIPSSEAQVTKGGHYVAYKDFNNVWLLCDDAETFVSGFPDIPLNIYVAFYRYGPSSKRASVPQFNIESLPNMAFSKVVSMFKAPSLPQGNLRPLASSPPDAPQGPAANQEPQVKTSEGTFVPPPDETEFMRQLRLQPKLLSEKPPPTKRKKKEEDEDYVPSTEDITEEDDEDDIKTIPEPKPKSKPPKIITKYGVRVSTQYLHSIGKTSSTVRLVDVMNDPTMQQHIRGLPPLQTTSSAPKRKKPSRNKRDEQDCNAELYGGDTELEDEPFESYTLGDAMEDYDEEEHDEWKPNARGKRKRGKKCGRSSNRFSKNRQSDEFAKYKRNILPKKPLMKNPVKSTEPLPKKQLTKKPRMSKPSGEPVRRSSRLGSCKNDGTGQDMSGQNVDTNLAGSAASAEDNTSAHKARAGSKKQQGAKPVRTPPSRRSSQIGAGKTDTSDTHHPADTDGSHDKQSTEHNKDEAVPAKEKGHEATPRRSRRLHDREQSTDHDKDVRSSKPKSKRGTGGKHQTKAKKGSTCQDDGDAEMSSNSESEEDPDIWAPGKVFRREKGKRRDKVDTKYRGVYRKWQGARYKKLHPSTIPPTCKNIIGPLQKCPGYCVLCPLQKQMYSAYDLKRHYQHMHRNKSWKVHNYTLLRCKCGEIKSQGTDQSNRNAHYHCHECQWPKKDREQLAIHYASKHSYPFEDISHLYRNPAKARALFVCKDTDETTSDENDGKPTKRKK